jgi:hypothetical protein
VPKLLESRAVDLYAEQGFWVSDAPNSAAQSDYKDMVRTRLATSTHSVDILLCPAEGDADVTVHVTVEVHDAPPPLHGGGWEHIVEASLHVSSGQLLVQSIEENEEFSVPPGWCQ